MSVLTLLWKCLRALARWPLQACGYGPGAMGVSRARASRAYEGFADAKGIHVSFDGKPIAQWAEFQRKEPDFDVWVKPWRDFEGRDRSTVVRLPTQPWEESILRGWGYSRLEVPDTFPEEWRRE